MRGLVHGHASMESSAAFPYEKIPIPDKISEAVTWLLGPYTLQQIEKNLLKGVRESPVHHALQLEK